MSSPSTDVRLPDPDPALAASPPAPLSAQGGGENNENDAAAAVPGIRPASTLSRLRAICRHLPTLAVFAALAAIGYWGHRTEWKLPRFSELSGAAETPDDWCDEHNVPESLCVECNPLSYPPPPANQWCRKHGVHLCPFDHPEIAQVKGRPDVTPADFERAERALALRPRPENNPLCLYYRRRIQFASHEAVLKAGIDVEPAVRSPITEYTEAAGTIRYDQTRIARLSSKADGTVWRVEKRVGDRVAQGELLALVDAAEVGRAKADLLTALADRRLWLQNYQRVEGLQAKGIIPGKQLLEIETALSRARTRVLQAQQALINLGLPLSAEQLKQLSEAEAAARLQFLGLPKTVERKLDRQTTTSNLLPIVSPLDGLVVDRRVVAGEVVDTSRVLFEVADTTRMWLMLNVPSEQAKYVRLGQTVHFLPDDAAEPIGGTVTWISTAADPKTRAVQVRAELPNPDGRLRDGTYGSGRVVLRQEEQAIVVPSEAIVWDGSCHIVFVRDKDYFDEGAPKFFHIRSVRPGAKTERFTELIAGIVPGEIIVTEGSAVLRAQLLKNNLGAG